MDKDIILRKLNVITTELDKLKKLSELSRKDYLNDERNYYMSERIIEKIVGAAIDINIHLIVSAGEKVPDTYYDSFLIIGRLGIVDIDFAKEIAESARMRNKIIHDYEDLEEGQVYNSLDKAVQHYTEYVKYIHQYTAPR